MPDPATLDAEGDDDVVSTIVPQGSIEADKPILASQPCQREGPIGTRSISAGFVYV